MRSMSFILVTLYAVVWIIGCAGMSPQLELAKSEIQYSKPKTSTHLIKGEIIKYDLWFDHDKWTVIDNEDPRFKMFETFFKKANTQTNFTHLLTHKYYDFTPALIFEEHGFMTNKEVFRYFSKLVGSDKNTQIISKEIRMVNGKDMLYMKIESNKNSTITTGLFYSFSNKTGSIVIAVIKDSLNAELESEIIDLFNGLVASGSELAEPKTTSEPYYNRGLAYLRKGQYDEGIIELTKAIELDPRYTRAYYDRGTAYGKKGEHDRAISDLTKAIELNPKHFYAYNNRGFAYKSKGQYDQAISDFTKAIELNPKHYNAYINRGLAYKSKGQYDQAISDFSKVIELNPEEYHAYIDRGFAYKSKGQYDQAISDYSKAIEINQKNPKAYNNIAWILATCLDARYRDGERAVELSQNAVELSRTSNHLETLAAAYAEAGKFEDAITTQEKVIDLMQKEGKTVTVEIIERLEFYKSNKPWRERLSKVEGINKAEKMEARDFKVTVITDLDGVRQFDIERVKRETEHALDSISSFLGIIEGKAIEVRIVSEGIVRTSGGVVLLPERYVKNKKAAIVTIISYILTKHYENNFFRVGLGVYFQERFGEDDGFPNFTGEPLNDLVRRYKDQLMPIDKLSSNNEIFRQVGTTKRRIAFIEAGSFIGFLVEKYGEQKIRELHNSGTIDYGRVYGKNIKELEAEWREFVLG
jgi:tetratricopeptide (TPR) repeat protein